MTSNLCFVMQPFDNDKFDKRYTDIFEPAISDCGLNPYRVDLDPGVSIPIEEIERRIRNSRICFAEITTNNPNVWYELGFAIACGKDVIMVCCTNERKNQFPFDIRHRNIITYDTYSTSSYTKLKKDIVDKIKAFLTDQDAVPPSKQTFHKSEDLSEHEISALEVMMVNTFDSELTAGFEIRNHMQQRGYIGIASGIAIKKLINKGMIQKCKMEDDCGNEFPGFFLLPKGEEWILKNEDKIILKNKNEFSSYQIVEELPF